MSSAAFPVVLAAVALAPPTAGLLRSCTVRRGATAILCAAPPLHRNLLQECSGSADRLIQMLSKEQLRMECAARSLPVSGTKAVLAPRLLTALEREDKAEGQEPPSETSGAAVVRPTRQAKLRVQMPSGGETDPGATAAVGAAAREPESALAPAPFESGGVHGSTDFELTILGSGACFPSPSRGASCTALRVRDSYWLFDVGEGTQVQLQRCWIRPSKIDKIFITHAHGDHAFGLPGLLCLIANGRDKNAPPLEIYGPHGLRAFIRVSLSFTGTRNLPAYLVHELHDVPMLKEKSRRPLAKAISSRPIEEATLDKNGRPWGEVPGSRNLEPARDGRKWWTLFETEDLVVSAGPVEHSVPCVGFVVTEHDKEGRLLVDKALPRLEASRAALREQGVRDPRTLLKQVKALGVDGELPLPNGDVIRGADVLGERRRGRKLVVLGDCCDASPCAHLASGADWLVHEATNAYLPMFGDRGGLDRLERETHRRGHSSPQMAGAFARRIGARALILTHFSQRYHPHNLKGMRKIAQQAAEASGLPEESVACAYDSLSIPLWAPDRNKAVLPAEAINGPPRESSADSSVKGGQTDGWLEQLDELGDRDF